MSDLYGRSPYGQPVGLGMGQLTPDEERTWALTAHLSGPLAAWAALGVLGPLTVLLLQGNRSPFVRRHAVEALNVQISLLGLYVLAVAAVILTAGLGLLVIVPGAFLVVVWALVQAVRGALAGWAGQPFGYGPIWRPVR